MKKPAQIRDPQSRELALKNLSFGMENNSRIGGLQEGSFYWIKNAFLTESNSIQSIPGYSAYCNMNGYRCISVPISVGNILTAVASSGTTAYLIGEKDGKASLLKTYLTGSVTEVCELPEGYRVDGVLYRLLVIDTKILIYNGQNYPVLWDLVENKLIQWQPLTDPTEAPKITTNIGGATATEKWTVHVTVSFNSTIGHTAASPKGQQILGIDLADMTDAQYFRITRPTPPAGAVSWNVYLGIEEGTTGVLFGLNKDPIPLTQETFEYNKNIETLIDMVSPTDNSTNPIIFNFANTINSRVWVTQISSWNNQPYPYTVAWSGTGKNAFVFSSSVGGGFVDVELGTPNTPQGIHMFRKNDGSTAVVLLTGGATSQGKRFVMEPRAVDYAQGYSNSSSGIQGFLPQEQLSAVGTVAGWSSVAVDTFLGFLSTQGLISTMTNQNSFNILSNNNISLKIQSIIDDIPIGMYPNIQVIAYSTRVFWRLFDKSGTPFILVYDYIKNAFTIIDIPVDAMFVDVNIPGRLKLGVVHNGELHYIDLDQNPDAPLRATIEANYADIANARTRTPYGRMIEADLMFEHLEPGPIQVEFNGVSKDDVVLTKGSPDGILPERAGDEQMFYRLHCRLYRDKIISDKVKVKINSTGLAYSLTEIHYVYDPSPVDFVKNRFRRQEGTRVNSDFVNRNLWDDTLIWNDADIWRD